MLIATESLSRSDKLRLIEQLWEELSREPESVDSPSWHAEALAEAEQAVADGKATFMEWEAAKDSLRRP
ncbi:MAG TPA: addiction module protein [Rhodocyclaceae bacterium]|nr:addiction module protein [Thiobacillaceae bacterium]HNL22471.1 addiction module protein [Rhodocyclaceae bacterium]